MEGMFEAYRCNRDGLHFAYKNHSVWSIKDAWMVASLTKDGYFVNHKEWSSLECAIDDMLDRI
jgi:hypothetical protein